ncbi:unnamed protein product [Anisakis simplex]|uniref:Cadherin domain-containing protein n=1 Tax=Anisakis simplex TaxID=6269 RepID=A0A0M3JIR4_ANISI|nr:unnamed protein product [Anisakis simplex]
MLFTVPKYEFVLNAESRDQLCSQRVIVRVEDVNDEFPKFDKAQYSATVKENCNATDEERVFLLRLVSI